MEFGPGVHLPPLCPGEEAVLTDEIVRMTTLTRYSARGRGHPRKAARSRAEHSRSVDSPHPARPAIVHIEEELMPLAGQQPPAGSPA